MARVFPGGSTCSTRPQAGESGVAARGGSGGRSEVPRGGRDPMPGETGTWRTERPSDRTPERNRHRSQALRPGQADVWEKEPRGAVQGQAEPGPDLSRRGSRLGPHAQAGPTSHSPRVLASKRASESLRGKDLINKDSVRPQLWPKAGSAHGAAPHSALLPATAPHISPLGPALWGRERCRMVGSQLLTNVSFSSLFFFEDGLGSGT